MQNICATGDRFKNAIVAPRANKVKMGDRFSTTMGLRGGLTNRVAYIAKKTEDLPRDVADYESKVAMPYFAAATWFSSVKAGIVGKELYNAVEEVAPKALYGWHLNPGHFVSSEEWMSSPIFAGSEIVIESGMMLQMDIIFSVPNYGGCNAEDGVAIADETLRDELAKNYPDVWARITARKEYMKNTLGIPLHDDVLPLSNTAGYVRPLLLNKKMAYSAETK